MSGILRSITNFCKIKSVKMRNYDLFVFSCVIKYLCGDFSVKNKHISFYLPAKAIVDSLDLSDIGAHLPRRLCTDGKKNPCDKPCAILQAITPYEPSLSATKGMIMHAKALTNIDPISNHFVPNRFPR